MTDAPTEPEGEGIWARLRRRKVVQWGLVYVAAAWGFLQGLEYVTETYHWPEQVRQFSFLVLLIGLPIVLVLAWYHGDRGQRRVSTPEFAILTLLLLLGGGAFWYYQRASEAGKDKPPAASAAQPATSPAVTDPRPSVAVLPFENRSREADDAFFVDGIHDDILTQLSKVSALRVISRTSVEQFRDTKLPMKAIADQLGVTKILEGGVQRAGDRVRINVQLIDAGTDAHLWADSYDRELTAANIFAIQSEVAAAIAGALKASLTASEQVRIDAIPTEDLEAWQAYQLGKQRMAKRTSAALAEAEQFFQRAIDRDPKFALAYVGLADTVRLQVNYSGRARDPSFTRAETLIARALTLAPDLPEAIATSATLAHYRGDYKRSEAEFQRSIALNPNYSGAHLWYGELLSAMGRTKEAVRQTQVGLELDPISAILNSSLGNYFAQLGRFDEALMQFREVIEIDPTMPNPYRSIGEVYAFGLGQLDAAMPWFEKAASLDPNNPVAPNILADLYLDLGDEAQAHRWLGLALEHGALSAYVQSSAALFALYEADHDAFLTHARKMAALNPRDIWLLRDADLRGGNYAVARARYAKAFPALFATELPPIRGLYDALAAIELAAVLQHTGERDRAKALLDRSEAFIRTIPRMKDGYGIADVAIHTLRGETATALAKLREAVDVGWSYGWRYHRDFDPHLASIRDEPEFKAIFADIERDMAQQRARLAARPKDAPLELTDASR